VTYADEVSRQLSKIPQLQSSVGVFVNMVGGLARVNVRGATVDIRCDGWYPPIPGMPVRVETLNGGMRVSGPSQTLPARAEVIATTTGTHATIVVDGVEYTLPVLAPYSPLVSDVVVINWMSGHILGEEAAAPDEPEPDVITGGDGGAFSDLLIQPTTSGKYDTSYNNWWSPPEVWASNNNKGIWVYGGRFGTLAGADVSRTEFYFPPPFKAVGAAYIGLHNYSSIPGGEPTITDLVSVPAERRAGWFECPTWWGNYLRDSPGAGIGVTSGAGDNRWPGVGQAGGGQSGWLRFSGTR
jgi:hypothetical protein